MVRKVFRLISPVFLFFFLFIPYSLVNSRFIVEWFGCGCPKTDEYGNIIHNSFNANDFTVLFWLFITLVVVLLSAFNLKLFKRKWQGWLYLSAVTLLSLFISYSFYQTLMWN